MSAALHTHGLRGVDLLLAHCEAVKAEPRRPVFERLREKIGAELTRLLLLALAGNQLARSARRGSRGTSAP